MAKLSEAQVLEAFRMLGLGSQEERAKFTRYDYQPKPEVQQDFIRLDNTTQAPEDENAKLARPSA